MNEKEKLLARIDYLRCIVDDLDADECKRLSEMMDNVIGKVRTSGASSASKGCNILGEGKVVSMPL